MRLEHARTKNKHNYAPFGYFSKLGAHKNRIKITDNHFYYNEYLILLVWSAGI